MAATTFCGLHSVDWMFGSLEVTTTFLLFSWLVPFPFTVFPKAFLIVFREDNGLFWLRTLGGSEARVSLVGGLSQLTAALMRCDKLSKLYESKTQALFLRRFPYFKRINRVYRFDGLLSNLAKMFLGYQCEKGWGFFDIPNTSPFERFHVTKIGKY